RDWSSDVCFSDLRGAQFKLIAGKAIDKTSPVPVHSKLYFIEIKSTKKQQIDIGKDLYGENALYILEGSINADSHHYGPKQILVAKDSTLCSFEIGADTTIYIFGGVPFEEKRYIHWNFVNSDKEVIEQAKKDWKDQNLTAFPKVPGDETDFVPLP